MISLAGNFLSYLNGFGKNNPTKCHKYLDELAKLEIEDKDDDDDNIINSEEKNVIDSNKPCSQKKGIITKLDRTEGQIDNSLSFPRTAINHLFDVQVGSEVTYLSFKESNEIPEKIVKIIEIRQSWGRNSDDEETINLVEQLKDQIPELFEVHSKSILCEVKTKNKSILSIVYGDNNFAFDFETVKCQFIPRVGDLIYLNCKVQKDYNFVDEAGEIVEAVSIDPLTIKSVIGTITFMNDFYGSVDDKYFFTRDSLSSDYRFCLNDKVCIEVIESKQLNFNWRCLKMIPDDGEANNKITFNKIHDSIESTEKITNGIQMAEKLLFLFDDLKITKREILYVKNTTDLIYKIVRVKVSVNFSKKNSQLKLISPKYSNDQTIKPGETIEYVIEAYSTCYGISEEVFEISFEEFKLKCFIEIEVKDLLNKEPSIGTGPIHQKTNYSNKIWNQSYDVARGALTGRRNAFVSVRMPRYEVPEELSHIVLGTVLKDDIDDKLNQIPSFLLGLQPKTYVSYFSYLIHLEEIQMFHNIRRYDRERAFFNRENEYLSLMMENISESRPSIVIGDSVDVCKSYVVDPKWYKGYVHKVLKDRILLKFIDNFHQQYNGEDYKLRFFFSRNTLRKQHFAIQKAMANLTSDYLFPTKIITQSVQLDVSLNKGYLEKNVTKEKIQWFNKNLNLIQKKAILKVLRAEARPMPYIIFGPPGTGKTMTLIEIILQICTKLPNSRILVGTPSNSAANLITERIIDSNVLLAGHFVRLVSRNSIEKEMIPEHLLPYCVTVDLALERTTADNTITTESGLRMDVSKSFVGKHLISIGTCVTLGTLILMGFESDYFTHVIIDEAGQLVESEAMIPLSFISKNSGQIILAGDPMQLGPVVASRFAQERGFSTSLLERLLTRSPYQKDSERFNSGYDSRLVTKLLYNYRSLPTILKLYNDLFYNSELVPMIKNENFEDIETKLLERLDFILSNSKERTSNCSVFFNGIIGENLQTNDSPSWYNRAEARSVFLLILKLYEKNITHDEIGIITPYKQQVKVIRKLFEEAGDLKMPKIGSVEEFQGQERDIIIVSTVRSSKSLIRDDFKYNLGFVKNSKRLNVAISRAKYLLVIFGNPLLLCHDRNWKHIIEYSINNNTYFGCNIPDNLLKNDK